MAKPKKQALTDALITAAAKRKGDFKLTDGGGLHLSFHNPGGTPTWRLRYMVKGKNVSARLGTWPETSLAQARAACVRARKAKGKAAPAPAQAAPAAPSALGSAPGGMRLGVVLAAAGAAVELLERMGFEWNGKRWAHAP